MINLVKDLTIRKFYILNQLNEEKKSYLHRSGWIKSFKSHKPVDLDGNPIPWLSLPLVYFLKSKIEELRNIESMFEYGAGNSTFFWRRFIHRVVSVEHDKNWFDLLESEFTQSQNRHKLLFQPLNSESLYQKSILNEKGEFQLILIDGRERVACVDFAIQKLTLDGLVIFDDTHRDKYKPGVERLKKLGFKELQFWGMGSGSVYEKCTSLFYRTENCFGI